MISQEPGEDQTFLWNVPGFRQPRPPELILEVTAILTSGISITQELVRSLSSQGHPRRTEAETLGVERSHVLRQAIQVR